MPERVFRWGIKTIQMLFWSKSEMERYRKSKRERTSQLLRNAPTMEKKLKIQHRERSSSRRICHDVYCSNELSIIITHYAHSHGWESFLFMCVISIDFCYVFFVRLCHSTASFPTTEKRFLVAADKLFLQKHT